MSWKSGENTDDSVGKTAEAEDGYFIRKRC